MCFLKFTPMVHLKIFVLIGFVIRLAMDINIVEYGRGQVGVGVSSQQSALRKRLNLLISNNWSFVHRALIIIVFLVRVFVSGGKAGKQGPW